MVANPRESENSAPFIEKPLLRICNSGAGYHGRLPWSIICLLSKS